MVLKSNLGARKVREIHARINCQLDLWDRGIYAGLVGVALKEVRSRKGRVEQSNEEEEDFLGRSFHSTLMSGKLWQAVRQAMDWEMGGGVFSSRMSARRPGD